MYACIARPICQFSQIQRVQYVCPISPAIYISQLLTSHPNLLSHITNTHPPKTKTKKTKKKTPSLSLSNPQLILHSLSPRNYQNPVSFVPGTPLNPSPQCSNQDTNTLPSPNPQSRENLKRPTRRWPHSQCRSPVPS